MTENQMEEAFKLHQSGQIEEAESAYLDVIADDPQNAEALKLLGLISCQTGKIDEGISYFEAAVEIAADVGEYRLALGRALFEAGRKEEGVTALEQAQELSPGDPEVFATLGYFNQHLQKFPEALRAYQRAAVIAPDRTKLRVGAGLCALFAGQKDVALDYLEKAFSEDKSIHQIHYGLALIRADDGDTAAAVTSVDEALTLDPDNPEYLRLKAELLAGAAKDG